MPSHITSFWILLAAVSVPLASRTQPSNSVYDFFWMDDTTKCFFDLKERFPHGFMDTRNLLLIARGPDAIALFERVRSLPINLRNETLDEVCGYCSMYAFSNGTLRRPSAAWMKALLMNGTVPDGEDDVLILMEVPEQTTRVFTDALDALRLQAERAHSAPSARATPAFRASSAAGDERSLPRFLYVTQEQMNRDVEASAKTAAWRGLTSVALVCACLFVSLSRTRSRHPLRLALSTLLAMIGILTVASSACQLFGIQTNAFSVVVAPMILGVGVDNIMIIVAACNRGKERDVWAAMRHCTRSIVAATFTTCVCFAFGAAFLPVPNIRSVCQQSLVFFVVSGIGQLTLFPALVEWTGLRRSPKPMRALPVSAFLMAAAGLALFAASLAVHGPPPVRFELQDQLRAETLTAQSVTNVLDRYGGGPSLTYALVQDHESVDWERVEATLEALPSADLVSWHRYYVASEHATVAAWMGERANAVLFGNFVNTSSGESVLIARTRYPRDTTPLEKHDATLALDTLRTGGAGACVFNSDLLGGYTITKLSRGTLLLVLATSAVCVLVGFSFIGARCAIIVPTLFMTYASLLGCVNVLGFGLDMILLVALLITPGLITDYALHMAHDVRNAEAVLASAATSVLSLVPFASVAVASVRHFMLLYILMIGVGCVWTIALIYPVHRYSVVAADAHAAEAAEGARFVIDG